ncbi:MAG TPA: monoamine oxidase, partial [Planctomycetaceae bacterium]|nr:monoamine oxidase [Planctomycetaceae bacterium]
MFKGSRLDWRGWGWSVMPGSTMHKRRPACRHAISRRRFSHLAALAGLSLAGRRAVAAPRGGGMVLVVGAGIAGLAAAIDLRAAGFTVVVIEGRDRVGGRISTDRSLDGVPLDMGATWIHGIRGNPINALRTKYRLKVALTNYDAMLRYDADGLPLSAPREASMDRTFASLEMAIAQAQEARAVDLSLGAFINDFIEARSLSADARRSLGYSVNTEIEHEQAADVADLSLMNFDQDSQFGGPDVLFPSGYGQLTERLKAGLDIRTGHTVRSIAHDSSGVRVETQRGTFAADRVVVTLPLGVLKHGDVGFTPILPEAKRAAIDRLGMGVLNKCYL